MIFLTNRHPEVRLLTIYHSFLLVLTNCIYLIHFSAVCQSLFNALNFFLIICIYSSTKRSVSSSSGAGSDRKKVLATSTAAASVSQANNQNTIPVRNRTPVIFAITPRVPVNKPTNCVNPPAYILNFIRRQH